MTSKKAKPKAAKPDYVLKPKERDAADNAMSRTNRQYDATTENQEQ